MATAPAPASSARPRVEPAAARGRDQRATTSDRDGRAIGKLYAVRRSSISSTDPRLCRPRLRFPLVIVVRAGRGRWPAARPARADENLLRGPLPFRKDNESRAHVLIGDRAGRHDERHQAGLRLQLQADRRLRSRCGSTSASTRSSTAAEARRQPARCSFNSGDVFETLGGVKWTFATPIPLVPYVGAVGGLVFAFPNGAAAAAGVVVRAVGGANYFFFDWLGGGLPGRLFARRHRLRQHVHGQPHLRRPGHRRRRGLQF